jgi:hypothetical protein
LPEALIFQHRPEIGRVIFISAPLRGSELVSKLAWPRGYLMETLLPQTWPVRSGCAHRAFLQ